MFLSSRTAGVLATVIAASPRPAPPPTADAGAAEHHVVGVNGFALDEPTAPPSTRTTPTRRGTVTVTGDPSAY